jgi:hypothetical protein
MGLSNETRTLMMARISVNIEPAKITAVGVGTGFAQPVTSPAELGAVRRRRKVAQRR